MDLWSLSVQVSIVDGILLIASLSSPAGLLSEGNHFGTWIRISNDMSLKIDGMVNGVCPFCIGDALVISPW